MITNNDRFINNEVKAFSTCNKEIVSSTKFTIQKFCTFPVSAAMSEKSFST